MRLLIPIGVLLFASLVAAESFEDTLDNDFAEFEDEDFPGGRGGAAAIDSQSEEEEEAVPISLQNEHFVQDEEEEVQVEEDEDDNEFEHFEDHEEFEGFKVKEEEEPVMSKEPEIKIVNVPHNLRQNWDNYYLEILMVSGLFVYFVNFITGRSKNNKIANTWFEKHRQLLEENFTMVGDDTNLEKNELTTLNKESENIYTLWCSGRTCCEGMLVELRLIKRQDLVGIIGGFIKPIMDRIIILIKMNKEDMDTFVFSVASKKTSQHFIKEIADINLYCPERRPGEKFNIPSNFQVMGEIAEASFAMLDSKVTAILNKYPDLVDFIHISDQFSGAKQTEDTAPIKLPDVTRVLMFGFNMPMKGKSLEDAVAQTTPLMHLVFYFIDKIKRYRLSKEGKSKADKNRQRVEEAFMKSTHQARAEAAATRREEKRRQEKEKVMADDDPERQKRWEIKEEKRQAKKRAPKMKQLKVKAL